MLTDFKTIPKEFISGRTLVIGEKVLMENEDYLKHLKKCIELHRDIKDHLPDGKKHFIDKLISIEGVKDTLTQDIIYEQGFKEGLDFKKSRGS